MQPWNGGKISQQRLGNDFDLRFNGLQVFRVMLVIEKLFVKLEILRKDLEWGIMPCEEGSHKDLKTYFQHIPPYKKS